MIQACLQITGSYNDARFSLKCCQGSSYGLQLIKNHLFFSRIEQVAVGIEQLINLR